ncbi:Eco57I restriction-modification methylase domain-containing protein [Janibacter indicus]|uniref:Eco57I restriction-modification methylase domain-containing protein n=1 Tax=Janibacter indicus TaxID=857417 RepID=UPI003D9A5C5F
MAQSSFVAVRIEGGVLPSEVLTRVVSARGDSNLPGMGSVDYHLAAGETVREAANRVWAYLIGAWAAYRDELAKLPEGDPATRLTRERWSLLLLDQLGYGRVPTTSGGMSADGKTFPVSHQWGPVPIHLLGAGVRVDSRTAKVAGAATASPQSMVQELLNRSDDHAWAILSNGRVLRLLRDSTSLVGGAFVEFDLEAIFDGDLFSDFVALYATCHQSRLEVLDEEVGPDSCWLERWRSESLEQGSRALGLLRDGVVAAIEALGTGLLNHPANHDLRAQVTSGAVSRDDFNHALLRLVYRLLFTFVAEDRGALLDPTADPAVRRRYLDYFSSDRLRRVARKRLGDRHSDRWAALQTVWQGLGRVGGEPRLGIVGIGGLFEDGPLDELVRGSLANSDLLAAVRELSITREPKTGYVRVVDYRNLGAEELGSIYESLLEYVPHWDPSESRYTLALAAGNSRKTTGAYYTPTSLIESLLDTALDPVLDRAAKAADPEAALLALRVCDPSCGSGHFLVAAARRIAKRVAALRTGDPEPPPEQVRAAMADVVSKCIYGVDVSALAVELAKVSLWMETMGPGVPMPFLDAQIKLGNSLIGATPRLVEEGLPQEAFKPITGDDKKVASALAKRNKNEAVGQSALFVDDSPSIETDLADQIEGVIGTRPVSLTDVHAQRDRFAGYERSAEYLAAKRVADAWCAAFVWPMDTQHVSSAAAAGGVTNSVLERLHAGEALSLDVEAMIDRLTAEYRFFHWHLEFPHVFTDREEAGTNPVTGWSGGFDAVLGNPPWEHLELKEQEFFAATDPEIAAAAGAKRKKLISNLSDTNPLLAEQYEGAKRRIDGMRHFTATSGVFPLCGRGRVKTDSVFAELGRTILAPRGRFGLILPTGIATDATTQYFFKDIVMKGSLASLYDFENRKPLFDGVDSRFKFCLLTLAGHAHHEREAQFAFFLHDPVDLNRDGVRFTLTPEEITLLNPNTGTCPVFRTRRDAEITLGIYRRVPVLINENDPVNGNPWGISFMQGLFNMTTDSHLFHTREELEDDGWVLNGNVFEREIDGGG